jgi:hypothetical protein
MEQALYTVDYYCNGELVASRHPTWFIPREGDTVEFTEEEVRDQIYIVTDVHFVVPESPTECVDVSVTVEAG